jgi:hypothetical protein
MLKARWNHALYLVRSGGELEAEVGFSTLKRNAILKELKIVS